MFNFNNHGVCVNPIEVLIGKKRKFQAVVRLAKNGGMWFYGYEFQHRGLGENSGCASSLPSIKMPSTACASQHQALMEALAIGHKFFSAHPTRKSFIPVIEKVMAQAEAGAFKIFMDASINTAPTSNQPPILDGNFAPGHNAPDPVNHKCLSGPEPLISVESKPASELDRLAEFVRRALPECTRAWTAFNDYRFMIGLALIRARELLAIHNNNPSGKNQMARMSGPSGRQSELGGCQATVADAQESVGLLHWMRTNFPGPAIRTLQRYRQWAETKALPAIQAARENRQLELPIEDLTQLDMLALPEPQRESVSKVLKTVVSSRDITMTLRAMSEIPGDPDHWGPVGGTRLKHSPRRSKAQIEIDALRGKGIEVARLVTRIMELAAVAGPDNLRMWDVMPEETLKEVGESLRDCLAQVAETLSCKRHAKRDRMLSNPTAQAAL